MLLAALLAMLAPLTAEEWNETGFFAADDVGETKMLLPAGFSVSKYGKGKYRIDGPESQGHLNCIFFTFESEAEASQTANLVEWAESTALVQDRKAWVREALFPNPFIKTPPAKAAMLKVRVTGLSPDLAQQMVSVAEAILKKNATTGLKF